MVPSGWKRSSLGEEGKQVHDRASSWECYRRGHAVHHFCQLVHLGESPRLFYPIEIKVPRRVLTTDIVVSQSDSGGPCVCDSTPDDPICVTNVAYNLCINELKRDYVTSTSAISLIATFLMGALANMPLGLAPGLGGT